MNTGTIVQVAGPVVDVEFPDALPAIYNALTVKYGHDQAITLEVQQHLGDRWVRTISMSIWTAIRYLPLTRHLRVPVMLQASFIL